MTEPTLEEMKSEVRKLYPFAFSQQCINWNKWHIYSGNVDRQGLSSVACANLDTEDDAWRDAYSKLPPMTSSSLYHAPKKPTLEEMMIRDATTKPTPESEDQAFERAWDADAQTDSGLKEVARNWWNARARLSAGGK